jgi:hypothetical protein
MICANYTYLLESGEESSADTFSDIPQFVLSRLNLTAERFSSSGNETEYSLSSQSGMMSAHSTENLGEEKLMSSVEDSLVQTSALQGLEMESMVQNLAYTRKCSESFAKWDADLFSWKTHQLSLFGGLEQFSEIWPQWGMMLNGECWEPIVLAQTIIDPDGGWLPTPTCADSKNAGGRQNQYDLSKHARVTTGKRLSVHYSEWTMGWPIGWTDLKPLETDKFQLWRQQHGGF